MSGEPARWSIEELKRHMEQFPGGAAEFARKFNDITPEQAKKASAHLPVEVQEFRKQFEAKGRTQPTRGKMNKVESAYALFLDQLKQVGGVKGYHFESVTLLLAPGCRYTPDFMVWLKDGSIEMHEVKTRWRNAKQRGPNMTDDARVKLLTAARLYPEFNFVLAWLDGNGGWHMENIEK